MTDKEEKQDVFDPISQKWHFEAHGDRWASLADGTEVTIDQLLKEFQ